MEVVRKIEDCGTTSGEPTRRVQIAECGQIPDQDDGLREKGSDQDSGGENEKDDGGEDEEEDGDRRGKKRQRVRFARSDDAAANTDDKEGGGTNIGERSPKKKPAMRGDRERDSNENG